MRILITRLVALFFLVLLSAYLVTNYAHASPAPDVNVDVDVNDSGGRSSYAAGAAIAGASGLCVKDWKPGWQKCVSWTMLDLGDDFDEDDDTVHAFGGGVTTRVDQFAVHIYGGFENLDDDDQRTLMIGGSLNWR